MRRAHLNLIQAWLSCIRRWRTDSGPQHWMMLRARSGLHSIDLQIRSRVSQRGDIRIIGSYFSLPESLSRPCARTPAADRCAGFPLSTGALQDHDQRESALLAILQTVVRSLPNGAGSVPGADRPNAATRGSPEAQSFFQADVTV